MTARFRIVQVEKELPPLDVGLRFGGDKAKYACLTVNGSDIVKIFDDGDVYIYGVGLAYEELNATFWDKELNPKRLRP